MSIFTKQKKKGNVSGFGKSSLRKLLSWL